MIVHVLPDTVYGNDFMDFLGRMYDIEKHYIYVSIGVAKTKIVSQNKRCSWEYLSKNNMREFSQKVKNADMLIVHGLFNLLVILWLFLNPYQIKKTIISIWGGELYDHRDIIEKNNIAYTKKMLDFIKGRIFQKVPVFLNDMEGDFELLKEWYHINAISIPVLYPPSVNVKILEPLLNKKKFEEGKNKLKILVGNSATETNYHEDIFKKLEKFKMKNIDIYCPLSYGDNLYADKVVFCGKTLFGDKFHEIRKFMPPEEYIKFLAKIDIAIFNNNRNQAMGNIALLAYLGSKIYLRNDTVMWRQYVEKGKCAFYSVDNIDNEKFEVFYSYKTENIVINQNYFKEQWDEENLKKIWDRVFNLQF